MVYEYPPSKFAENLTLTIIIHIALILAALLPIFFVWVRTKTPAKKREIWFITVAMVLVPVGGLVAGPSLPSEWIRFILLYTLFFEIVSLVVIARRLRSQGQATSVVGIIGSLFGLGFLILCLLPATPSAREVARRMQCSNNLKNIEEA